jgi:extradiol dioxygenase family protein
MKRFVTFTGYNAYDFYGHTINLVENKQQAEYEIVIRDTDELVKTPDFGVVLKRNGIIYNQIEKMNSFRGVSFIDDDGEVISCKLLKIK